MNSNFNYLKPDIEEIELFNNSSIISCSVGNEDQKYYENDNPGWNEDADQPIFGPGKQ